jgi:hypothetical protein
MAKAPKKGKKPELKPPPEQFGGTDYTDPGVVISLELGVCVAIKADGLRVAVNPPEWLNATMADPETGEEKPLFVEVTWKDLEDEALDYAYCRAEGDKLGLLAELHDAIPSAVAGLRALADKLEQTRAETVRVEVPDNGNVFFGTED